MLLKIYNSPESKQIERSGVTLRVIRNVIDILLDWPNLSIKNLIFLQAEQN